MKKQLALLSAVLLTAALTVCGGNVRAGEAKDPILIAMSMCKQDENFTRMRDILLSCFAEFRNPSVEVIWTNAEDNMEKQLADVEPLLVQDPDGFLLFPVDSEGAVPALEAIVAAGVPVCDSGYLVNSEKQNVQILEWEELELGRMQGYYINDWLKANPGKDLTLGYIEGSQKNTAQLQRWIGFIQAVHEVWGENTDRVKVVARQNAPTWSTQEAIAITEDWLQTYPDINAIVCAADVMATGTINVLNAAGKNHDEFIVLSIDGTEDGLNYVKQGTLDGTVYMDMEQSSRTVAEIVYNVTTGKKYDSFRVYSGAGHAFMVTPETVDQITEFDD